MGKCDLTSLLCSSPPVEKDAYRGEKMKGRVIYKCIKIECTYEGAVFAAIVEPSQPYKPPRIPWEADLFPFERRAAANERD